MGAELNCTSRFTTARRLAPEGLPKTANGVTNAQVLCKANLVIFIPLPWRDRKHCQHSFRWADPGTPRVANQCPIGTWVWDDREREGCTDCSLGFRCGLPASSPPFIYVPLHTAHIYPLSAYVQYARLDGCAVVKRAAYPTCDTPTLQLASLARLARHPARRFVR